MDKTTIDVPEYYIPYWERAQETFGTNAVEMIFEIVNDVIDRMDDQPHWRTGSATSGNKAGRENSAGI